MTLSILLPSMYSCWYPKSNFGSSHWSHAIVLIQYNRQRTTRVLALLATCLSGSLTDYQTDALVNNCYKSCWRWSVSHSQHACFWNSQTDSQMYTFPNQMNSQVVQIFMKSKFQSKTSCTGQRWRKTKDFFVFCSGEIFMVFVLLLSVICVL